MSAARASFWQRAAETAAAFLLLAAPVAVLLKTYDPGALRSAVFQLAALAALLAWALKSLERGRFELSSSASQWLTPAAMLAAWVVLRWGLEAQKAAAVPALLDGLLAFGLFTVAGLELGGYRTLARISGWALIAAWPVALLSLAGRATFLEPKTLGLYLALCAPLAAFKRLDPERDGWLKRVDLALLVLAAAAAARSGSAEGVAAFALVSTVTGAILAAFVPSKEARKEAVILLALGALAVAAAILTNGTAVGRDALYQLDARRALWPAAFSTAFAKLVHGHGLAGFETALSNRPPLAVVTLTGAHGARLSAGSDVLQLLGDLGLIGLVLALWAAAGLWKAALRARAAFARSASVGELAALAALTGAVFGGALCSLLGVASLNTTPWLFAPLAGALGGLTLLAPRDRVMRVIPLGLSPAAVKRAYAPAVVAAFACAVLPARWLAGDLNLNEGVALAQAGRFDEAAARFDLVDRLSPSGPRALYFLGNARLEAGDNEGALAAYDRLSALSPDYALSNYHGALAAARAGKWEDAVARAARQRDIDPTHASNEVLLADAARRTGNLELARQAALTAVALEPNDPLRWSALSAIYAQERKATEAADAAQKAKRLRRGTRKRDG